METLTANGILIKTAGFDLKKTFECGQCFRFDPCDGGYAGVAYGRRLTLTDTPDGILLEGVSGREFDTRFYDFFDLGRDYAQIDAELAKDPVLAPVVPFSTGIRILRQEPFETLVSFIISASNNIPRIKKIIGLLCDNFGEDMGGYHAFPTPGALAALSLSDLAVIRAGFRDKYILDCARRVASGTLDLDAVAEMPFERARSELMTVSGVGLKVAECALLYGFGFHESFPKDVWIKRVLKHYYGVEDNAGLDFHGHDGIAQQYLFYYAREHGLE